ncbi:uncharacterized protein LOC113523026 [Galleria mellonella]|uniref:Uncharacterized protein LOC113523026 n=1 Tax=Galleria mellonella TaxID=7137 RepID=A0A6J3CFQ5_GALME|nr:uncharacterized protein LOC113523026 [Galleria mellonella]
MVSLVMISYQLFLQWCIYSSVLGYMKSIYTITDINQDELKDSHCKSYEAPLQLNYIKQKLNMPEHLQVTTARYNTSGIAFGTIPTAINIKEDPIITFNKQIHRFLFGHKTYDDIIKMSNVQKLKLDEFGTDSLIQYPSGNIMRAELFENKSSVHMPISEYMHRGYCNLKITKDYMQTAVNAFSIFLEGNLDDILRLPPMYVLRSARTIAMMKIGREKLAATWTVVKAGNKPSSISYQTLEMYRPLFKYLNGREIARLNLSDDRILMYIGTHADLNRHQVGVVASKYIQLNKNWMQPKYLNMMNNLLCGVPMTFMRKIPENTYLQLAHQVFYHIRACDPLQRRFYLAMMTKTQALGKSYSWSARDVSRLGLLLAEVEGPAFSAINPEAMSGITAQIMMEIPPQTLKYITEMQLRYIGQKPLNILAKKLKMFQEEHHENLGYSIVYDRRIAKLGIAMRPGSGIRRWSQRAVHGAGGAGRGSRRLSPSRRAAVRARCRRRFVVYSGVP